MLILKIYQNIHFGNKLAYNLHNLGKFPRCQCNEGNLLVLFNKYVAVGTKCIKLAQITVNFLLIITHYHNLSIINQNMQISSLNMQDTILPQGLLDSTEKIT